MLPAPQELRTTRSKRTRTSTPGALGLAHAGEHESHGGFADLAAVLVDGGERDGEKFGIADVVDADDADDLGHAHAELDERAHEARGR